MGKIISFEGIHGCGKSTQAKLTYSNLLGRGYDVKQISSNDKDLSKYAMAFLEENGEQDAEVLFYLALANDFILNRKFVENPDSIFILDRYIHTNMASTYAAGKNKDWILDCIKPFRMPDMTFLVDLSPNEAYKRKGSRVNEIEEGKFQKGHSDVGFINYQERIRKAYLEFAKNDPKIVLLDGAKSISECNEEIVKSLEDILR